MIDVRIPANPSPVGGGPQSCYLSDLLGAPVHSPNGVWLGVVSDVLAAPSVDYPAILGLVLSTKAASQCVSIGLVSAIRHRRVELNGPLQGRPLQDDEPALRLARYVLDRQILDSHGHRLVRVNDLQIAFGAAGGAFVVGIDVSTAGLLRRLGVGSVLHAVGVRPTPKLVPWESIQPVASWSEGVQLGVARGDLARMHPADIALLVSQLDQQRGADLLAGLEDQLAADTLGEVDDELQVELIKGMSADRAADILEDMDPDEAADLLGDLAEEEPDRAADLLARMEPDDADEVRHLLAFEDDSAGGLMTTDYVTIPRGVTVGEAIGIVLEQARGVPSLYYAYVVENDEQLAGALSLHELIIAEPADPIESVMHTHLVTCRADTDPETVARLIATYNLLAIPVLDPSGAMLGIVTVDDAMAVVLPENWKSRVKGIFGGS